MIYVHLAEGFEEVEALTIVDLLRRAQLDVKTVSMEETLDVMGVHDVSVKADVLFSQVDYNSGEMIVLPGGQPGTSNLMDKKDLMEKIKDYSEQGKYIAAICAAPMILGELGLLIGKNATIYSGMESFLKGGQYNNIPVVVDGNIITSQGPATAMIFALELIKILKGHDTMENIRKQLLFK